MQSDSSNEIRVIFRDGQQVHLTPQDITRIVELSTVDPVTNTRTVVISPDTIGQLGICPVPKKG